MIHLNRTLNYRALKLRAHWTFEKKGRFAYI